MNDKLKELVAALDEFTANTSWRKGFIPSTRVLPNNMLHIEDEFSANCFDLPYSDYALPSIRQRADADCVAVTRLGSELFIQHMNEYYKRAKHKCSTINLYDGTIYACHSNDYKILSVDECFYAIKEAVEEQFESYLVSDFYVSPTETIVDFLIVDDKVSKVYENALERKVTLESGVVPVLRFITSNTGWSGANLYPVIYVGKSKVISSEPLKLKHNGNASIDKFRENCKKVFTLILDGAEKLKELSDIQIEYPANCAANIAKEIGLSKKATLPLIYKMEDDYGYCSCTAKDVYLYLTRLLEDVSDDAVKQFKLSDQLSRALTLDFSKFDRAKATWLSEKTSSSQVSFFAA